KDKGPRTDCYTELESALTLTCTTGRGFECRKHARRRQWVLSESNPRSIEERVADRRDYCRQNLLARPTARLAKLLNDDRRDGGVLAEPERLIRIPVQTRHVRAIELHFFAQREARTVVGHADDLALDDPWIDGQPAVHRTVHVFGDNDSVV